MDPDKAVAAGREADDLAHLVTTQQQFQSDEHLERHEDRW